MEKQNKIGNIFTVIMLLFPLFIMVILWIAVNFKCGSFFYGLFNIGMYLHLTVTKLCNVFMAQDFTGQSDTFWKMLFMFLGSVSLSLSLFI